MPPKVKPEEISELKDMLSKLIQSQTTNFDSVNSKLESIQGDVASLKNSLTHMQDEIGSLKDSNALLVQENKTLKSDLAANTVEITALKNKLASLEDHNKKYNLILGGITETKDEDCEQTVRQFFNEKLRMADVSSVQIDIAHRLRQKPNNGVRDIIVRSTTLSDRNKVWACRRNLNIPEFAVKEHFSQSTEDSRKVLYPYFKTALANKKKATLKNDKLIIDGKVFSVSNLPNFKPLHTIRDKDQIFFHGKDSVFSNFFPCTFTIDGIKYNCVEQFYQYNLIEHHKGKQVAEEVMKEDSPSKQKSFASKQMRNTETDPKWLEKQRPVMLNALMLKFDPELNPSNYECLMETGDAELIECNKYDTHWAIGLGLHGEEKFNRAKWRGENALGFLLCEVRERLKNL